MSQTDAAPVSAAPLTLTLTLASSNYDRTRALIDGRVRPAGITLNYIQLPVEEIFERMQRDGEFDAAEMSLSFLATAKQSAADPWVAIPVFPSRMFRHGAIYVNDASGIRVPADLIGKRVGLAQFHTTAVVWIRGILEDEYGVPARSVRYCVGGIEAPRNDRAAPAIPGFEIELAPPGATLAQMLRDGAIDALYAIKPPSGFATSGGPIRRLFAGVCEEEQAYFQRTQIYPIMHALVVQRPLATRHPWIVRSLYDAFVTAKALAYDELRDSVIPATMLPWGVQAAEAASALMGTDFWPYGIEANRTVLDTFLRYHHAQNLTSRRLTCAELFASLPAPASKEISQ